MKPPIKAEVSIDAEFYLTEDGEVYFQKLVTNELPVYLSGQLIESLSQTLLNYYEKRNNKHNHDSNSIS